MPTATAIEPSTVTDTHNTPARTPAALVVALFIVLRDLCPGPYWPKVETLLKLTGAARSQAYEYAGRIQKWLPQIIGQPGRPATPPPPADIRRAVQAAIQAYLYAHPGAVCGQGTRAVYSDSFRRFVLQLQAPGQVATTLSTADLADIAGVPLGTLKDWLSVSPSERESAPPVPPEVSGDVSIFDTIRDGNQRLLVNLWPSWEGTFKAFCAMVRSEHRFPYGETYIATFLQAVGLLRRKRRTPVEAPWSSGTYRRFYPGAHWLGDGTLLNLRWGNKTVRFNLEVLHDVASDATVGLAITDTENEEALRMAYDSALETTAGQPPEVLSLDNKPSNHSPGAVDATPGATLLRSTPGRGQAKAPLEGLFGLFQQAMPPLVVDGATDKEKARQVLQLIATAWFLGRNGKPRKRLNGKTPAEAYTEAVVTPEEKERLLAWMREQQRRQDAAQQTREARRDPVRIELLTEGLRNLGIPDADGRLALALACYSQQAIVRGLATFQAKQELGTVPGEADPGRYLGGIIRQLHTRLEMEATCTTLLQQRLRLGDLSLAPLQQAIDKLRSQLPTSDWPRAFVDQCLAADRVIDGQFWREEAGQALEALPAGDREQVYRMLCKRIAASFKTDRVRREDLIARLADAVAAPAPIRTPSESRAPAP